MNDDNKNIPVKPTLTPEMQKLADESGLELALTGGLALGMNVSPRQWVLADKYRVSIQSEKMLRAIQVSAAVKYLSALKKNKDFHSLPESAKIDSVIGLLQKRKVGR